MGMSNQTEEKELFHAVSLSGGKDSTATIMPKHIGMTRFCDFCNRIRFIFAIEIRDLMRRAVCSIYLHQCTADEGRNRMLVAATKKLYLHTQHQVLG